MTGAACGDWLELSKRKGCNRWITAFLEPFFIVDRLKRPELKSAFDLLSHFAVISFGLLIVKSG